MALRKPWISAKARTGRIQPVAWEDGRGYGFAGLRSRLALSLNTLFL
jgi:hypothetical protein